MPRAPLPPPPHPSLPQPLSSAIRFVVVLWGEPSEEAHCQLGCPVLTFQEVLSKGEAAGGAFRAPAVGGSDIATLVYTSGTTGHPKVSGARWHGAVWHGAVPQWGWMKP